MILWTENKKIECITENRKGWIIMSVIRFSWSEIAARSLGAEIFGKVMSVCMGSRRKRNCPYERIFRDELGDSFAIVTIRS